MGLIFKLGWENQKKKQTKQKDTQDDNNQKKHRKNKIENTWQGKDTGTYQRKDNNRYKLAMQEVWAPYWYFVNVSNLS